MCSVMHLTKQNKKTSRQSLFWNSQLFWNSHYRVWARHGVSHDDRRPTMTRNPMVQLPSSMFMIPVKSNTRREVTVGLWKWLSVDDHHSPWYRPLVDKSLNTSHRWTNEQSSPFTTDQTCKTKIVWISSDEQLSAVFHIWFKSLDTFAR